MNENSMKIAQIIAATLDGDNKVRREDAEQQLTTMKKIIGFGPSLLTVIMTPTIPSDVSSQAISSEWSTVRQAAVVFFKNLVSQSWTGPNEDDDFKAENIANPSSAAVFIIHEQDKVVIRDNLLPALQQISKDLAAGTAPHNTCQVIMKQLSLCVSTISVIDFPGKWNSIIPGISSSLQGSDPWSCYGSLLALLQIVKNYEYKKANERKVLYEALTIILPQIYQTAVNCSSQISNESSTSSWANPSVETQTAVGMRKTILKIFKVLTEYVLPLNLLNNEVFTKWMELFNTVVLQPLPSDCNEIDEEERPNLIWWKEKKWGMAIMNRILSRYATPGDLDEEYKQFAPWFVKTFGQGIVNTSLTILQMYRQGVYVSPRVMYFNLDMLDTGVSHISMWKQIKPHFRDIIEHILIPISSYTPEDHEMWESDPYEYVKTKFDVLGDYCSLINASDVFLNSVCLKRKGMLNVVMGVLMNLIGDKNQTHDKRDGTLSLIGHISTILLRRKMYKDKLESFLVQVVFSDFQSEYGHLRARACWMIRHFSGVKFKNREILANIIMHTVNSVLKDKDIPVKVEAAIALQMLLTAQGDDVKEFIEPQIGEITMELLQILRDTENDDLTNVLQKIVCSYKKQLMPLAQQVCHHLVGTFIQMTEGEDVDDKTMTSLGIMSTLETLLAVMNTRDGTMRVVLEPIILTAVHKILTAGIMGFYEEALSLLADLTQYSVSESMWQMLPLIYQTPFSSMNDGLDYFVDMMPLLHHYIVVGKHQFVSNPANVMCVLNMCKSILIDRTDAGEDSECHACKLLECIVIEFRSTRLIDAYIPSILSTGMLRLFSRGCKTSELITQCLQVCFSCLYYDRRIFFDSLCDVNVCDISRFGIPVNENLNHLIRLFMENVKKTDVSSGGFGGIHDRKMAIITICCLLEEVRCPEGSQNKVSLPQCLTGENVRAFVPALIKLFEGIGKAYEMKEDDDDETSDDDSDGSDSDEESEEEEEDVAPRLTASARRRLRKKAANAAQHEATFDSNGNVVMGNGGGAVSVSINENDNQNHGDSEDSDNDSDDDSIFEDNSLEMYSTAIDESSSSSEDSSEDENEPNIGSELNHSSASDKLLLKDPNTTTPNKCLMKNNSNRKSMKPLKEVVDEYQMFKDIMTCIQMGHIDYYNALMLEVNEDGRGKIKNVLTTCEQRRAARDLKNAKRQQGYTFSPHQATVPSQFSFSPPSATATTNATIPNFAFGGGGTPNSS